MFKAKHSAGFEKDGANSITVVVCAYTSDRWVTLQRALSAAAKQITLQDELIVIVDHNELLLAQCRESFSSFEILPNSRRTGLSGARNTAIDAAQGSVIVFLDDDAVPSEGWLEALRAPYTDIRVCGVGGLATPRWPGAQPKWFPDEFLWVVGCSYRGLPSSTQAIRNLAGANMSFRRAAFDKVGGFAEHMGRVGVRLSACEETEFSIRLTQANPDAIILFEPSSQVEHNVGPQRASLRYFIRRCWAEGLSKAEVSRRVGSANALSSERHYVSHILPRAVWKGIHDFLAGDIWGTTRSVTIILGLIVTAAGYCASVMSRRLAIQDKEINHVNFSTTSAERISRS